MRKNQENRLLADPKGAMEAIVSPASEVNDEKVVGIMGFFLNFFEQNPEASSLQISVCYEEK